MPFPRSCRLDPHIGLVSDGLHKMAGNIPGGGDMKRRRIAAAIALLRTDTSQADSLVDRLTDEDTPPNELSVIRRSLIERGNAVDVAQQVWKLLNGGPRLAPNSSTFSLRLRPIPTGWLRVSSPLRKTIACARRSFSRSGATPSTDFRRGSERAWSTA